LRLQTSGAAPRPLGADQLGMGCAASVEAQQVEKPEVVDEPPVDDDSAARAEPAQQPPQESEEAQELAAPPLPPQPERPTTATAMDFTQSLFSNAISTATKAPAAS